MKESILSTSNQNWKRTFFIIWSGQAFSQLGSAATQFGIVWWLAITTKSATVLALACIAGFLPQALIGPFAGVVIDRYSRKTVMIAADLFIAAASIILLLGFSGDVTPLWLIYGVLFLRSIGATFHGPAMQAAMPMLVPESELMKVGAWSQLIVSGSLMAGPVIGAAVMSVMSIPGVMLMDVTGAILAVTALAFVKIPDPPAQKSSGRTVLTDLHIGYLELRNNHKLLAISVPVILALVAYMPVNSLFPLMVGGHFGGTAWHASAVEFVFAGGMLVSSIIVGVWGGLNNKFLMINLALAALGCVILAAGLLPPSGFVAFAILSAGMGMTSSFLTVPYFAFVQSSVKPEALGRVLSLLGTAMTLATPIGLFVAGPGAKLIGVAAWFALSGILIIMAAVFGYFLTRQYKT
jgi:DHA3 family macrolide efflux protein-like MFS transporter